MYGRCLEDGTLRSRSLTWTVSGSFWKIPVKAWWASTWCCSQDQWPHRHQSFYSMLHQRFTVGFLEMAECEASCMEEKPMISSIRPYSSAKRMG